MYPKYQVPANHAILSVTETTFHVHSDNAMIDSGSGFIVSCWDRGNQKPVEFCVHQVPFGVCSTSGGSRPARTPPSSPPGGPKPITNSAVSAIERGLP